jgi:peptidoglycan DL-endopeptidase CwlO
MAGTGAKFAAATGALLGILSLGHSAHGSVGGGGGSGATGAAFVHQAKEHIGAPYVFGAAGPAAFDCSGLVQYSLAQLGITAPRTSEQQWAWVHRISYSALRPGDLIFEQWPGDQAPPGHVVIYAGHGQVVEAPQPGEDVRLRPWSPDETWIVGYGQIPGVAA